MKKLVSLVLVMVMVLSLFTIVPFTTSAADTKTVYFQNNWMWTDVKVYMWDAGGTALCGEWPGTPATFHSNDGTYDIYSVSVPSNAYGVIFNGYDGGIGSNNQTPDILDSADGDMYYMIWNNQNEVGKIPGPTPNPTDPTTPDPVPGNGATVYFQNNWMWSDVNVYMWDAGGTALCGEWPGTAAQLVGNDGTYDIYGVSVPSNAYGVIFNGYDAGMGGNNQTPDITGFADKDMYYMVWNEPEAKNDLGKTIYNPDPIPTNPVTEPIETQPVTEPVTVPVTEPVETQPEVDGLFVKIGGKTYEVNKGDVITYRYYLSVDSSLKISSLDINMFYDTEGLDLVPYLDEYGDIDMAAHFPIISGGTVQNFAIDGEIYYNYSSVAGIRLANDALVFTAQFEVTADKGLYEITEKIITLADSDMNKIVYAEEVLQDVFTSRVDTNATPGPTPTKPTETTPIVDDGLYVVADGEKFAVKKGDVLTYTYYLSVDSALKISSLDINTFYDTEGLDFVPFTDEYGDVDVNTHFPKIYGGCVYNFGIDGELYYNYSNVAGVRLANDSVVFTGNFKVTADKGTYNIYSKLVTLADSDMNKIVYNHEVIQPDAYTARTELVGGTEPTEPETKPTEPTQPTPTTPTPTNPVTGKLFVKIDGVTYPVSKGDVLTYQYILNVPSGLKISSIDMNTFYDTEGIDFIPYTDEYGDDDVVKHFPKIYGGCVHNFGIDGEIYYNYSNVAGIRLTNDAVMFEGQFKVTADEGTYEIYTNLVTLADSDMNKIVYNHEVIQNIYEEKEILVGYVEPTVPTNPNPDRLIGDVNGDGVVSVFDVTAIQRYAAQFITLSADQLDVADVNNDGTVNIFDASEIQRYLAGDIKEFKKK